MSYSVNVDIKLEKNQINTKPEFVYEIIVDCESRNEGDEWCYREDLCRCAKDDDGTLQTLCDNVSGRCGNP